MVVVTPAPPVLPADLELFHTTDPLLSNSPVVVFYGPAATNASSSNRIQVHVFTPAGFESFPRLAISPTSPYYAAVNALPREEQGDEVIRGLAFGLSKYFAEIPHPVRDSWIAQACSSRKAPSAFALFSDPHIAILASRMTRVEEPQLVFEDIQRAIGEQYVSWLDLDVLLPPGSIHNARPNLGPAEQDELTEDQLFSQRYGAFAPVVRALGEPAFLPTSKVKHAPSKPTALGRGELFVQDQKEVVRKEMCELVDTEESYVRKLATLIQETAVDLREQAGGNLSIPVQSPVERIIKFLFPASLESILEVNTAFLAALQNVLDSTADAAFDELEQTSVEPSDTTSAHDDFIGILAFAQCLQEWFPKFAQNYPSYINGHARVPHLLRQLAKCAEPAVVARLQEMGEQRLMSMLIEPIQRLPRYTLYIDGITKQLPVGHPALKGLLKARDIISEICAQDATGIEQVNVAERLQRLVQMWPADLTSPGRLVTIVDMSELEAPYDPAQSLGIAGLILLFTSCIVFVEKSDPGGVSARALLADLDKPASMDYARPVTPPDLHFVDSIQLGDVDLTEYLDGQAICVLRKASKLGSKVAQNYVLLLEGTYAGKASKFCEEVTKTRVEGRFLEAERENVKWDVRCVKSPPGDLNLYNAVFEDLHEQREQRGATRLVIEPEQHRTKIAPGKLGVETVIGTKDLGTGQYQLTIDSVLGSSTRDKVDVEELLPVLLRRLTILLQARSSWRNPAISSALITRNQQVLQSLSFMPSRLDVQEGSMSSRTSDRSHRPISPVKLLSSFLSSTGPGSQNLHQRKTHNPFTVASDALSMPPPDLEPRRPATSEATKPTSRTQVTPSTSPNLEQGTAAATPVRKVESTLSTYLLALQARKGNVVGSRVKNRRAADESAVNELYNALLDSPSMMVLAAQAQVDVLFAAFEKFLNVAWTDQHGPIISRRMLQDIQYQAECMFPVQFEKYFKDSFHSMSPSNQRALRGVVKLLAELLDGTGNDSDRGILTATVAEILVPGEDPYTFVSLIDRFVDNIETLFGETVVVSVVKPTLNGSNGPTSSHGRSRSANTGPLASNTSSLRKKFGFSGITRHDSKSEPESKGSSVWRTLSKNRQPGEQPSSISRGTMHGPKSSDVDAGVPAKRPATHEQPSLPAFPFERHASRDAHTFMQSPLGAISEQTPTRAGAPPRKKRRSSTSDLNSSDNAADLTVWSPPSDKGRALVQNEASAPESPSPSVTRANSVQVTSSRIGTPSRGLPRSRLPSAFRPENSPGPAQSYSTGVPPPKSSTTRSEEVVITSHGSVRRPETGSGIPARTPSKIGVAKTPANTPVSQVRSGLAERPSTVNEMRIRPMSMSEKPFKPTLTSTTMTTTTTSTSTPTKRLKMQSPQKIRERLQVEQKALSHTSSSLADELSKIGDEISALPPGRMGSVRGRPSPYAATHDMSMRLATLEASAQRQLGELTARTDAIHTDLTSSLTVSEAKIKKLDELYREANAENEALYARFNDELGRVLRLVKKGEGVEELRRKVAEGQKEAEGLRRELARVKRENAGLRSQIRE